MPIVMMMDTPHMTPAQYDKSLKLLGLEGKLPPGCRAHIAGPAADGTSWRVITIWETVALARQFMVTKLRAVQEAAGIKAPVTPPVTWELHNLLV